MARTGATRAKGRLDREDLASSATTVHARVAMARTGATRADLGRFAKMAFVLPIARPRNVVRGRDRSVPRDPLEVDAPAHRRARSFLVAG
jgi:hypothetical protein